MTVQAELDSGEATVEFILCVEGIGFPRDPSDLSIVFDGTVFTTGDLNGDLATVLGCTIAPGLELPESVSDQVSLRNYVYTPGGLDFSVIDHDDVWLNVWAAVDPDVANTVNTVFAFDSTTIRIDEQNFTSAEKDVVWIGGSEAVKLGTKALVAGSVYEYTGCERGFAGTRRGNYNPRNAYNGLFSWEADVAIYEKNPRWKDRKVSLFMHIPGEARANCVRLYTGIIADLNLGDIALRWNISSVSDVCPATQKRPTQPLGLKVVTHQLVIQAQNDPDAGPSGQGYDGHWHASDFAYGGAAWWPEERLSTSSRAMIEVASEGGEGAYDYKGLIWGYNYRTQQGGTGQAYTDIVADETDPLTLSAVYGDFNRHFVYGTWSIGSSLIFVEYKEPEDLIGVEGPYNRLLVRVVDARLGYSGQLEEGESVRLMIDNIPNSWVHNRFYRGQAVTRNPIDMMLMFFTSMPGEYLIFDTSGVGTTTRANESGASLGTADLFNGYSLHCLESDEDNLRQARVITDHASTYIDVSPGFDNSTDAAAEYQVRNTDYDVLPAPFAMGIHNQDIDVSAFEQMREQYFPNAEIGRFVLGEADNNLWDIIQENICRPYGIILFQDRTTGKLSCKHIPPFGAVDSILNDDFVTVGDSDIISIEDMNMIPEIPVVEYELSYRPRTTVAIRPVKGWIGPSYTIVGYEHQETNGVLISGSSAKINIRTPERKILRPVEEYGVEPINAMFHDADTIGPVADMLASRLVNSARELPRTRVHLGIDFMLTVQVGTVLKITSSSIAPIDPSTGTRGWTNLLARVVGTEIRLDQTNPGIVAEIRILGTSLPNVGAIAPACNVTGKGTHGAGPEYFAVDLRALSDRYTSGDWNGFNVGDLIELRTITGALKESEVIESFGANEASTTAAASTNTVNVTDTIGSAIATGDYITFAPYVTATVTSNMAKYSYYADSNDTLDADVGQLYG